MQTTDGQGTESESMPAIDVENVVPPEPESAGAEEPSARGENVVPPAPESTGAEEANAQGENVVPPGPDSAGAEEPSAQSAGDGDQAAAASPESGDEGSAAPETTVPREPSIWPGALTELRPMVPALVVCCFLLAVMSLLPGTRVFVEVIFLGGVAWLAWVIPW